jgi:hypothetical protein
MSQYVITIIPVGGDDDFDGPVWQAIVRIDAESGRTSVKELTIRAADGGSLSEHEIPHVDVSMLVRAFDPAGASDVPVSSSAAKLSAARAAAKPRRTATRQSARGSSVQRTVSREAAKANRLNAGRAYRRAPSAEELEGVYAQTGTIAGVAAHFDVPVHTAQGWISRLRRNNAELTGH